MLGIQKLTLQKALIFSANLLQRIVPPLPVSTFESTVGGFLQIDLKADFIFKREEKTKNLSD